MNEKNNIYLDIAIVVITVICFGAIGFAVGRGNFGRPLGLESANRELTETIGELTAELTRERAITERLGVKQDEERILIRDALDACGRTGSGLQGVIAKMEILNGLIRELERGSGGDTDISGSE